LYQTSRLYHIEVCCATVSLFTSTIGLQSKNAKNECASRQCAGSMSNVHDNGFVDMGYSNTCTPTVQTYGNCFNKCEAPAPTFTLNLNDINMSVYNNELDEEFAEIFIS